MTKHTPGPWYVKRLPVKVGWAEFQLCYGKDDECVADIVYEKADADLMAVAPEMLKLLEELCDFIENEGWDLCFGEVKCGVCVVCRARGTIAQAKGESEK